MTLSTQTNHRILSLLNQPSQHNEQNKLRIRCGQAQPQLVLYTNSPSARFIYLELKFLVFAVVPVSVIKSYAANLAVLRDKLEFCK